MDLGSIHACVSACGARNGERGSQLGAVRGPDLHCTRLHVHASHSGNIKQVHQMEPNAFNGDAITIIYTVRT